MVVCLYIFDLSFYFDDFFFTAAYHLILDLDGDIIRLCWPQLLQAEMGWASETPHPPLKPLTLHPLVVIRAFGEDILNKSVVLSRLPF